MGAPLAAQVETLASWGLPRRGLLIVMSACEGRCFFCASPPVTHPPPSLVTPWARIEQWLLGNRDLGLTELCLGGTEPPTHVDFQRTLSLAADVGFRSIQLMTSGLSLAANASAWHSAGITSVCSPLYAADAALHDRIVGVPGHHARVLTGLDTALATGITVHVHTLALRQNLAALHALGTLVRSRWAQPLVVAPVRPKDGVFDYASEAPDLAAVAHAVTDSDVALVGFPLCIAPHAPRGGPLLIELYFRSQRRGFGRVCEGCSARSGCPGVVAQHLIDRGDGALEPMPVT
jgi:hypothetical protein